MNFMKTTWMSVLSAASILGLSVFITNVRPIIGIETKISLTANRTSLIAVNETNVGGPLPEQLHNKPVIVDISASWCGACKNIAPTLSQLKQDYAGKAYFIDFDVTDRTTTAKSRIKAERLGLGEFFDKNKSKTAMVVIIDPTTGNIISQEYKNKNLADYTRALNSALAKKESMEMTN